ncbi:MAG: class I SAM-dependent methyltransferase [Candidatus Aenigmarchaeota archaeon]|nr:class I SAM-dependent methyltransferase [Candidatus Aenigmarchaeota archaeon]
MNKSQQVLREIETQANWQKGKIVGVHTVPHSFLPIVGREKGKLLEDLIKKHKPKLILEIGTLVGYSAILMAHQRPDAPRRQYTGPKIVSLEIDPKAAQIAKQNIEKAELSNKIEIIVGDAKNTIKKLDVILDMIFIDAKKDEYIDYLKLCEKNMHKGTIVVADNVKKFADDVENYLDHVRKSGLYESKYHDFGFDAMEVSIRK